MLHAVVADCGTHLNLVLIVAVLALVEHVRHARLLQHALERRKPFPLEVDLADVQRPDVALAEDFLEQAEDLLALQRLCALEARHLDVLPTAQQLEQEVVDVDFAALVHQLVDNQHWSLRVEERVHLALRRCRGHGLPPWASRPLHLGVFFTTHTPLPDRIGPTPDILCLRVGVLRGTHPSKDFC
jgi:hypothetical protein